MNTLSIADLRSLHPIQGPDDQQVTDELRVLQDLLPLDGAQLLELGCGAADKTRQIAERTGVASIVAAEVDQIQHQKNLQVTDLDKVTFTSFGAEAIDAADGSFDIVLMFKSLHHVPLDLLDEAFAEVHRVLKPGGLFYISEPVFAGAFNEVIRLFHDEQAVRTAAFEAMLRAMASGLFEAADTVFFKNVVRMKAFSQFENGILNATFMDHNPSEEVLAEVRRRFEQNKSPEGYVFEVPNRVNLLRRID